MNKQQSASMRNPALKKRETTNTREIEDGFEWQLQSYTCSGTFNSNMCAIDHIP
jgi:hypothetical protein